MPDNSGLISKETIARLFNISERRVEQLAHEKIIPKVGWSRRDGAKNQGEKFA